jgi:hypothetical protein
MADVKDNEERIFFNEGIVFNYLGKEYKLTGLYGPINQIMNLN